MKGPPAEVFRGSQFHLTWPEHSIHLHVDAPYFDIAWDAPLFNAEHKQHPVYPTFGAFSEAMLVASTDILWPTKPMQDRLGPVREALDRGEPIPMPQDDRRWPFGHTFDVASAEVYVRTSDNALHRGKRGNHPGAAQLGVLPDALPRDGKDTHRRDVR